MREVIVGVPFYKNAQLVDPLVRSILGLRIDRSSYRLSFLFVVDSPSDIELVDKLKAACSLVRPTFPVEMIVNESNLGFVRSANVIIAKAVEADADLILLNSDVELFEDTVQEMLEVAESDPMIGFVSPRTNDTTICTFPVPSTEIDDPAGMYADFRSVARRLPRAAYVPTAVGFCLLIKGKILRDFGSFDPIFGRGYNEENDLIMRANRCGYAAAIANWAFAYHSGGSSFALASEGTSELERRNSAILNERHSHYYPSIHRYFASPEYRSLVLVSKLRESSRLSIAFDFSSFGTHKNGTTEYGTNLLKSFVKLLHKKYAIFALCAQQVWQAHGLDKIDGLKWSSLDSDEQFSAVVRLSQPFNLPSLAMAPSRGAVTIVSMLDTIAYDCLQLRDPNMHRLWSFVMQFSDAVIYISEFSKNQFVRRFMSNPKVQHEVCMPSTDIEDYAPNGPAPATPGDYLLVVGNHFPHKSVRETVLLIREALPFEELRVLGVDLPEFPDVPSFESGHLHETFVRGLFRKAKAVVFPSHYEGFGFPLMHALGNHKVVFVRDMPVTHEIKARVSAPENIRVFKTNDDLVAQLTEGEFEWASPSRNLPDVGWDRTARELDAVLARALKSLTAETIEARRAQLDVLTDALNAAPELAAMHRERDHLRNQIDAVQRHINAMQNSTSWRITAPMRKLKQVFSRR